MTRAKPHIPEPCLGHEDCDGRYLKLTKIATAMWPVVVISVTLAFGGGGWAMSVVTRQKDHEKRIEKVEKTVQTIKRIESKLDTIITRTK